MANFPTVNSPGDTFHSGSNLYSWTGTAWKIVAGDRPDYGVVTFEGQVFGTPPDVLLHFNSDSSSAPIDASTNALTSVWDTGAGLDLDSPSHFPEQSSALISNAWQSSKTTYPSTLGLDGEFTVDFWIKVADISVSTPAFGYEYGGNNYGPYFAMYWHSGGGYWWFDITGAGGGNFATISGHSPTNNVWMHVAITRDSSNYFRAYFNGAEYNLGTFNSGSETFDWGAATAEANSTVGILPVGDHGGNAGVVNIDEFRIVKGERMWTADFSSTFSSSPPGPYDENVTPPPSAIAGKSQIYAKDVVVAPSSSGAELLLHFDGNLNDTSGNNHTIGGNGTIVYSSSGAGGSGASGYGQGLDFDNSSTYLTVSDMDIGTSNFTVEFWWKWPGGTNYNTFLVTNPNSGQTGAFSINHATPWGHSIWVGQYNGSGTSNTYLYTGFSGITGNWYHWAIVRNQTQMRLYIGEAGNTTGNYKTAATATPYYVGGMGADWQIGHASANYMLSGSFADFRVTKDELYTGTGTYTLPTAPFPEGNPGSNTTELYMMDGSGTETKLT